MTAKNALLPAVCAFLAALYFAHPLIQTARGKNGAPVKSAIINPAEKNDIAHLVLEAADGGKITISKAENLWTGRVEGLDAVFPCAAARVNSFIEELTAVKKTYRLSRGTENTAITKSAADFTLSWTLTSGKTKSVYVGRRDFSQTMRFIYAGNGAVSKIEGGFDAYLDTSARFWCDPYIIPRLRAGGAAEANILRLSFIADGKRTALTPAAVGFTPRMERILSLRHGGPADFTPRPNAKPVLRIEAEFSNGSRILIPVYRADGGAYLLSYDLYNGALRYGALISEWTCREILK
ncbi:MAG: hypothetical protein ACTTKL_02410 [Treponema sp.]